MPSPQRNSPFPTELAQCPYGCVAMAHRDRCRSSQPNPQPAFCRAAFAAAACGQNPHSFRHTGRQPRGASCRRGVGVLLFWRSPHATYDDPRPSGRLPDRLVHPARVLLPLHLYRVRRGPAAVGRAGLLRPRGSQGHAAGVSPLERQADSRQKYPEIDPRKLLLRTNTKN